MDYCRSKVGTQSEYNEITVGYCGNRDGYRLATVAIQSAIQSEYSRKYDVAYRKTVLEGPQGR